MISVAKQLEIDGQIPGLVEEQVRLMLSGIGWGQFQVRSEDPPLPGKLLRYTISLNETAFPIFLGVVSEVSRLAAGFWLVRARELSAALESPVSLAMRHVTPPEVLAALEEKIGLEFLVPVSGTYVGERQPYFFSQGSARIALEQMGAVWEVRDPIWCQLPDGRVFWGAWENSPFNTPPLSIDQSLLIDSDQQGGFFEIPCLPALRPGMSAEMDGQTKMINQVTFFEDRTSLQWKSP